MARPKRILLATAEETSAPPAALPPNQFIARVEKAAGNNLYHVQSPTSERLLAELPPKFRSTFWLKRGGFVVVDTGALADRENKIGGEIVNVVRNEKEWRKRSYWPKEFAKTAPIEDDDESQVGRLPPSDSEEEE